MPRLPPAVLPTLPIENPAATTGDTLKMLAAATEVTKILAALTPDEARHVISIVVSLLPLQPSPTPPRDAPSR